MSHGRHPQFILGLSANGGTRPTNARRECQSALDSGMAGSGLLAGSVGSKKIGAEVWLRGESNDLAPTPFWKRAIKRVILGELFRRVDRFLFIGTANRRLYKSLEFRMIGCSPLPMPWTTSASQLRQRQFAIRNHPPPHKATARQGDQRSEKSGGE